MIIDLNIASYTIRLQSEDDTLLTPGERFSAFVSTSEAEPDIVLKVYSGEIPAADGADGSDTRKTYLANSARVGDINYIGCGEIEVCFSGEYGWRGKRLEEWSAFGVECDVVA